jgi:2-polyprenyl-6-methoxyphenol hydroxylase-like FAD-dependent oxidoreductase
MMNQGDHAVVLGASMAGLLAARVVADFYTRVTLVDRDALPVASVNRRGVPQGRHPHALLARGGQTLNELFPEILDELAADGAPVWADGDLSLMHASIGGHLMVHTGKAAFDDPKAMAMYQPSRPHLEHRVRQRLRALENVTILDGHEVTELASTADRRRVTGVHVIGRDGGDEAQLDAELVIDAMGRAARTPAVLQTMGYGRPPEDRVVTHTTYVSQHMRMVHGALAEMLVTITPVPGRPTGMFLVANEGDNWIFTVYGMAGHEPPRELSEMFSFAEEFAPAHVLAAVRAAEPVGSVVQHRLPSSRWRRYDKMRRFPDGLLVTGDAMCSFNPIYGQGISVAALDAMALREALQRGQTGLSRRYFRAAAKAIAVAWALAAGSDLAFPDVEGRRTVATRLTGRFADWILSACEVDAVVHAQFFAVTWFVDRPACLLRPSFLLRVAKANLLRPRDSQSTEQSPATSLQSFHPLAATPTRICASKDRVDVD